METKNNKVTVNPKKRKILIGVAGLGLLALSGFGYWFFFERKKNDENNTEDFMKEIPEEKPTPNNSPKTQVNNTTQPRPKPSPATKSAFPLKLNSKGNEVKALQEALISKYGKSILPKYGADGWFGKELISALKSKGFPSTIDETTFNQITAKEQTPAPTNTPPPNGGLDAATREAVDIAKNIWLNASINKLQGMLDTLARIKSVQQYVKVNEIFRTIRLRGVRQTIVNAALSSFSDATAKQLLTNSFIKIGLKYNDGKWSLSGLHYRNIHRNKFSRHV